MYEIDGFRPVRNAKNYTCAVHAGAKIFQRQKFVIWYGNVRRTLFICEETNEAIYHYYDLSEDRPQEWFSRGWEDYIGLERIKAKDLTNDQRGVL